MGAHHIGQMNLGPTAEVSACHVQAPLPLQFQFQSQFHSGCSLVALLVGWLRAGNAQWARTERYGKYGQKGG